MNLPGQQLLYWLYRRRLRRQLAGGRLPRHVGIVMDGNRRRARAAGLVAFLMGLIEELAHQVVDEPRPRWRLHIAGVLEVLPDATARALKEAVEATASCATVAVKATGSCARGQARMSVQQIAET